MAPIVVTLVHGTFARNAQWTRAGSKMHSCLGAVGRKILFNDFAWSGFNSVRARTDAAARLSASLEHCSREVPGARHVVIGHSHGGAVGLLACCSDRVRDNVVGVVCIATPFICVQSRPSSLLGEMVAWALLALLAVPAFYVGFKLDNGFYGLLIWFGLMGVCGGLEMWFQRKGQRTLQALADFQPTLPSTKVLLMRTLGDEASMALGAGQFLAWVGLRVSRLLSSICDLVDLTEKTHVTDWSLKILLFGVPIAAVIGSVLWRFNEASISDMLFGFVIYGCAALMVISVIWLVLALVCAFVVLGLIPLIGLLFTPFGGGDVAFAGMFADVSVEAAPCGVWQVVVLSERSDLPSKELLRHSMLYADDRALAIICRFLDERLADVGSVNS
jgi:hypothetical protein